MTCPAIVRGGAQGGHCYDTCKTNRDCIGVGVKGRTQICCQNECGGHVCAEGVPSDLICPPPVESGMESSPCREGCISNDECRNGQMCCLTDLCTFKCVYGVHPT